MSCFRHLVSKKKKRFREDGFDLDLSYITPSIIAMGFPSRGLEALYRNPMSQVKRFLEKRHPEHYKVYNLCSERSYDPLHFHGRVEHFPFDDHQACPISLIFSACENVREWLARDPENLAAIHCKAGKGRTGLIICAFMVQTGISATVADALKVYGEARTKNGKGLTIPSQIRYLEYFARCIPLGGPPVPIRRKILSMTFGPVPKKGLTPSLRIVSFEKVLIFDNVDDVFRPPRRHEEGSMVTFDLDDHDVWLEGDILFQVLTKKGRGSSRRKVFHFWVNPLFVDEECTTEEAALTSAMAPAVPSAEGAEAKAKSLDSPDELDSLQLVKRRRSGIPLSKDDVVSVLLQKPQIDKVHKDKKNKKFSADFVVKLVFLKKPSVRKMTEEVALALEEEEMKVNSAMGTAESPTKESEAREPSSPPAETATPIPSASSAADPPAEKEKTEAPPATAAPPTAPGAASSSI